MTDRPKLLANMKQRMGEETNWDGDTFASTLSDDELTDLATIALDTILDALPTLNVVEVMARGVMLNDPCGCTLEGGERVFCNDARLPDHVRRGGPSEPCECQSGGTASLNAMVESLKTKGNDDGNT